MKYIYVAVHGLMKRVEMYSKDVVDSGLMNVRYIGSDENGLHFGHCRVDVYQDIDTGEYYAILENE